MRLPGHKECDRCHKLWASECVVFVPNGQTRWWRVDARRQSFPYHHQATHSRIGWDDETKRLGRPDGESLCHECRGVARPEPTRVSVAREARNAWEAAVAENPALAKYAPRLVRRS